jgi:hypothetical protein
MLNAVGYLTISLHFLSSAGLVVRTLGTKQFEDRHTAIKLSEKISKIFELFSIKINTPGLFLAASIDNASNVYNVLRDHLHHIVIPCLGHTLNLTVEASIKAVG